MHARSDRDRGNAWGVGRAGTDNGVLLVIALSDRTLRIATGDGLRTRLPDSQASEIVGGTITPLLRAGRTSDAVLAGLDGIRTALGHDVTTTPLAAPGTLAGITDPLFDPPTTEDHDSGSGGGSAAWLWILLLVGLAAAGWVMSLAKGEGCTDSSDDSYSSNRRRSYRSFSSSSSRRSSSSSSSRRSSGFGGGRSSGGGASGRW